MHVSFRVCVCKTGKNLHAHALLEKAGNRAGLFGFMRLLLRLESSKSAVLDVAGTPLHAFVIARRTVIADWAQLSVAECLTFSSRMVSSNGSSACPKTGTPINGGTSPNRVSAVSAKVILVANALSQQKLSITAKQVTQDLPRKEFTGLKLVL